MSGGPVRQAGSSQWDHPARDTLPADAVHSADFGDLQYTGLTSAYLKAYMDWCEALSPSALPPRSMIGPSWLGRLVSSSLLLEVEGDDLRHRICGELFLNRNGRFNPTGTLLSELAQTRPVARLLQPHYQRVLREAVPARISLRYLNVKQQVRDCEILALPFGVAPAGGKDVAFVLSIYNFLPITAAGL